MSKQVDNVQIHGFNSILYGVDSFLTSINASSETIDMNMNTHYSAIREKYNKENSKLLQSKSHT